MRRVARERTELFTSVLFLVVIVVGIHTLANMGRAGTREETPRDQAREVMHGSTLSPAMWDVLKRSRGFQFLISYTDRGFEPNMVTIKRGESVRFTNNSDAPLWVAATGKSGTIYPGTGDECGQSAFDSCMRLAPGEFWEYTFTLAGTWSYKNNLDSSRMGVIRVR